MPTFGAAVINLFRGDRTTEASAFVFVEDHYQRMRAVRWPRYRGPYQVVVTKHRGPSILFTTYGWHVDVPKEYLTDADDLDHV